MKTHYLLLFFTLFFLTGCFQPLGEPAVYFERENGRLLGGVFVELADNPEERARGLMYREELREGRGMLFIFEREDMHSFWMKNTLLPLDLIFISEELTVVDIIQAAPCKELPCANYTPEEKALYVVEVNQGYAKSKGIKIGDKVTIYVP